jgi:superfamily II DNA helicase RecQ
VPAADGEAVGVLDEEKGVQGEPPDLAGVYLGVYVGDRMALRCFAIPVHDASAFEQELNGFLARHRVVSIDRRLIDQGANSFWAICVDHLDHVSGEAARDLNLSRSRVDYKAILPAEEFAVFSQLRSLRKELAQSEAAPVYALFTNERLAQMVQRRWRSKADLAEIEGIGDGKIDKYAERLLPLLLILGPRQDASSCKLL